MVGAGGLDGGDGGVDGCSGWTGVDGPVEEDYAGGFGVGEKRVLLRSALMGWGFEG